MSKIQLTSQEKIEAKQRNNLQALCNAIASAFNFKQLKTWHDVYKKAGQSEEYILSNYDHEKLSKAVTFPELKGYFETLKLQLEESFTARRVKETDAARIKEEEKIKPPEQPLVSAAVSEDEESGIHNDKNYGLIDSPNESCYLFWFQRKAVKQMLDNVLIHKLRGQLLLASTGTGKTYMCGAFIRRLVDIKFTEDKTFGPTEYLYVTRATIVEQTKRVFEHQFKLGPKDGVEVLNIEQLRSRAGALWVNEKTIIQNGEERTVWEWRKGIHPVVLMLDECQAVKNEGSTQSNIINSFAEIPTKITHTVFVSATPFCKVTEAKSFVLNCHFEDKELGV